MTFTTFLIVILTLFSAVFSITPQASLVHLSMTTILAAITTDTHNTKNTRSSSGAEHHHVKDGAGRAGR